MIFPKNGRFDMGLYLFITEASRLDAGLKSRLDAGKTPLSKPPQHKSDSGTISDLKQQRTKSRIKPKGFAKSAKRRSVIVEIPQTSETT